MSQHSEDWVQCLNDLTSAAGRYAWHGFVKLSWIAGVLMQQFSELPLQADVGPHKHNGEHGRGEGF